MEQRASFDPFDELPGTMPGTGRAGRLRTGSAKRIAIKNLENEKLQSPPYEEIELSQRTGQLVIVCLMGRGTPSCVK